MNTLQRFSLSALLLAAVVSPVLLAPSVASAATAPSTTATSGTSTTSSRAWLSGASGYGVSNGQFAAWRGSHVNIAGTWSDNDTEAANFWQFQPGGDLATWDRPVDVAVGAIDAGETWQAAATGAYDARWTASLQKLASLRAGASGTTYIRFAHEMNGNWYPWSVDTTNYRAFDAAWKRYRALQKAIFPTAKLVFCVNRESVGAGMNWEKFFPGKAYVDVLAVDSYNEYPFQATDADFASALTAVDKYGAPKGLAQHLAFAKSQGLPLAIPEWSGDAAFGDSPVFVTDFLNWVSSHAGTGSGQVAYEILFNVGGYDGDFQLDGPDARMPKAAAAYQAFFASKAAYGSGK